MESDLFMVVDPESGRAVFTTDYAEDMAMPEGVDEIKLKQAVTNRVMIRHIPDIMHNRHYF